MLSYEKYGPIICITVILAVLFILWAFFGGKEYPFVGLAPLAPESQDSYTGSVYGWGNTTITNAEVVDNINFCEGEVVDQITNSGIIDNTPKIPEIFTTNIVDIQEEENKLDDPIIKRKVYSTNLEVQDVIPAGFVDKPNGGPLKKGRGKGRFVSRGERLCRQTLERIYGAPFISIRPIWLTNPETGEPLELDCYNEELKIALEYNGEQHYKWPNFTKQSYDQFVNQLRRDKFKADLCEIYGIYLIIVPYIIKYEKIPSYIMSHLPETIQSRIEEEGTLDKIFKA